MGAECTCHVSCFLVLLHVSSASSICFFGTSCPGDQEKERIQKSTCKTVWSKWLTHDSRCQCKGQLLHFIFLCICFGWLCPGHNAALKILSVYLSSFLSFLPSGKGGSWKRKDAFSLNWFAGETTNSSELLLASVIVVFSKIHRLFPLLGPCIDLPSARDKSRAANSIFTICFPNLSSRLLMFSRWQAHLREAKLLMTMSTEKTAIDFTTHSA